MEEPIETSVLERCYKIITSDLEYLERIRQDILIIDPSLESKVCEDCLKISIDPVIFDSSKFNICNIFAPMI